MSELNDRRARKKAKTRAEIRGAAHQLFAARGFDAVTIADVAAEADVAVQTVFNHFATKEDLFFDGRTPWVDGAADAVRTRKPSVPPLTALKNYLVALMGELAGAYATEEWRCVSATIEASSALRTRELQLVDRAEQRLSAALAEAWSEDCAVPSDQITAAAVTAATWLAVARVLLVSQRPLLSDASGVARTAPAIKAQAERLFGQLEQGFAAVQTAPGTGALVTGWPGEVRQAG